MTGAARAVDRWGSEHPVSGGPYPMGLAAIVVTVGMLFMAFTAAVLIRRTGADWVPVKLPPIVWLNTVVLALSSGAVELARRAVRRDGPERAAAWLGGAGLLGAMFLTGQLIAWRDLVTQGVLLSSNPHAAFFYTLSAAHGAHALAGLVVLGWTARRAGAGAYRPGQAVGLAHAAVYWHLVGGVWLWVLGVLSVL